MNLVRSGEKGTRAILFERYEELGASARSETWEEKEEEEINEEAYCACSRFKQALFTISTNHEDRNLLYKNPTLQVTIPNNFDSTACNGLTTTSGWH